MSDDKAAVLGFRQSWARSPDLLSKLDTICHTLRLPRRLYRPICDRIERDLMRE